MTGRRVGYSFDPGTGRFLIEEYNWAAPFSDFLPGIAGALGIPAWVYWVDRAQGVMGMGVGSRHDQILEFYSFNKACSRVGSEGFRTFVSIDGATTYEPFRRVADPAVHQTLSAEAASLRLIERNERIGLDVEVAYTTLPERRMGGLLRTVTLTNTAGSDRHLEWLDGIPRILPAGIDQHGIKMIPRHIEAMFGAEAAPGFARFRLKQSTADSSDVARVEASNVYVAADPCPVVVDPRAVFGDPFDFTTPLVFAAGGSAAVTAAPQITEGMTPCAFAVRATDLSPGATVTAAALIGRVDHPGLIPSLQATLAVPGCVSAAFAAAARLVEEIEDRARVVSASPLFDAYVRQTFLDNVLRGGMPITIPSDPPVRFSVYTRQNGDLERDYHLFGLTPTYLSQGMGHYRNLLQNRRTDAWWFSDPEADDLAVFVDLIQLDGYNPLEVRPRAFRLDRDVVARWAADALPGGGSREQVTRALTSRPVTPGEVLMVADDAGVDVTPWQELLGRLLTEADPVEVGGIEAGFWIDHWHYLLDMIDTYLAIYPDRLKELMTDRRHVWFDNPDRVAPRSERLVELDGTIRQRGAVVHDEEKARILDARGAHRHTVRVLGTGEPLRSSLVDKLVLIAATRIATLDAGGVGIEMEAGKPGWNDSLNGLPGLLGSSLIETLETLRLVRNLLGWLPDLGLESLPIPEEIGDLVERLTPVVDAFATGDTTPLAYWDEANLAKEDYRQRIRLGVSGRMVDIPMAGLIAFLDGASVVLEEACRGRGTAVMRDGVPLTYFRTEVEEWEIEGGRMEVRRAVPRALPLTLEGPAHWIRAFPADAAAVYDAVRSSPLFDGDLGMYRLCEQFGEDDFLVGRAVGAYPRGWLENESIYTHMEFKWLLEVLRAGLVERFWADARTAVPAFMDPAVYGRNPAEGVSFIVSSVHADPTERGRGYQPRLSGMTAEFLSMWMIATVGERPFQVGAEGLRFAVHPSLPAWLLAPDVGGAWPPGSDDAPAISFTGLAGVRFDLYGAGPMVDGYVLHHRTGEVEEIGGPALVGPAAESLRGGRVHRVQIRLVGA